MYPTISFSVVKIKRTVCSRQRMFLPFILHVYLREDIYLLYLGLKMDLKIGVKPQDGNSITK